MVTVAFEFNLNTLELMRAQQEQYLRTKFWGRNRNLFEDDRLQNDGTPLISKSGLIRLKSLPPNNISYAHAWETVCRVYSWAPSGRRQGRWRYVVARKRPTGDAWPDGGATGEPNRWQLTADRRLDRTRGGEVARSGGFPVQMCFW